MNNILIEYGSICSATEAFIFDTKKNEAYYESVFRYKLAKDITEDDLNWADTLVSCRPFCYDSYINAVNAKKANVFYSVYFDDDLLNWNESFSLDKKYAIKCLKLADLVSSTSPLIAKEYSKYVKTGRYYVENTAISAAEIINVEKKDSKIRFVFAAGASHEAVFQEYIAPILDEFLDNNKDADITFIGVHPELANLKNIARINYVSGMPLDKYKEYMANHHFDIGFSPLEDSSFNNRKYFNKYIEYSKAGICGIYSNVKPYTYIVKDGENGLLVDNNPESWLKAMIELTNNDDLRNNLAKNAQDQLRNEFTQEKLVERDKIANHEKYERREKIQVSFTRKKYVSVVLSLLRRIWLTFHVLKHYGIKEVIVRIKRHL